MAGKNRGAAPITENEYAKELLHILKTNSAPGLNDFTMLLVQVNAMQKQLNTAVRELAAMRRDLAEAEKRNHPIRNAMQKAVAVMKERVAALRDKLAGLKQAVIDGCKKAVAAFKEKGVAALDGIARFFNVRPVLEAIHADAEKAAQAADRAISNIDKAGARFHEAGRNLKNAGRALSGKQPVLEAKPNGKAVKIFTVPFRAASISFNVIGNHAAYAVKKLEHLEERAAARKPPIKEVMRECGEKAARENRAAPKREQARTSPEL